MVKGECFTILDGYGGQTWPSVFYRIPNIGESVRAKEGKWLRVVGITHAEVVNRVEETVSPYIIVELHKSFRG